MSPRALAMVGAWVSCGSEGPAEASGLSFRPPFPLEEQERLRPAALSVYEQVGLSLEDRAGSSLCSSLCRVQACPCMGLGLGLWGSQSRSI